jgi:hypothetical protein
VVDVDGAVDVGGEKRAADRCGDADAGETEGEEKRVRGMANARAVRTMRNHLEPLAVVVGS